MNINELTIGQANEIAALVGATRAATQSRRMPMRVGKNIFIRGVTMAYTGEVVAFTDYEVALRKCTWIADTGRFAGFVATGKLDDKAEVEPYPDDMIVNVNREAYADWHEIGFDLPRSQK